MVRKYYKRGHTQVDNQIVLASGGTKKSFEYGGRCWVEVMSLVRDKRIAIPLKGDKLPSGKLRLILKGDNKLEIHYPIKVKTSVNCGTAEVGIDKGFTEAFVDSDDQFYGSGLGDILAYETEHRHTKGKNRNKLRAIAQKCRERGDNTKSDHI